ncbi:hypothetical protein GCM10010166_36430 [Couchioplanes caeruleus subsp. azureus]|nr:hypothetical protein GCM10010166_36430 [Couchioplanes caeruleus subsp. azureus]
MPSTRPTIRPPARERRFVSSTASMLRSAPESPASPVSSYPSPSLVPMTAETVLSPSEPGRSLPEPGRSPSEPDRSPSDPGPSSPSPSACTSEPSASASTSPPSSVAPGPGLERPTGPSLSPSRAADFKTCPLLFRFRTIDRLPEQPTRDQVRGTLVHAVLERLFDLPAPDRTPEAAAALVSPEWERLVADDPGLSVLFGDDGDARAPVPVVDRPAGAAPPPAPPGAAKAAGEALPHGSAAAGEALPSGARAGDQALVGDGQTLAQALVGDGGALAQALPGMPEPDEAARLKAFLASTGDLLDGYFAVEDPRRLEPAERESLVSTLVDDELLIRGYIDRLDVSPAGDLRVVDYKTGGAPREAFEGRALFQLKFYALVLWRTRGVVPRVLRLLYLKDAEVCDYSPDADELERFERTLVALSHAIERAKQDRDFRPKPSRLCGWCSHQQFCPEFGGTPPPYPEPAATPSPDQPTVPEQPTATDQPVAPDEPSATEQPIAPDQPTATATAAERSISPSADQPVAIAPGQPGTTDPDQPTAAYGQPVPASGRPPASPPPPFPADRAR